MGIQKTLTNWNSRQKVLEDAFWGPVSASINWCEADYDVSRHIAEFINTLSNLPFLFMALFGIRSSIQNQIPINLWLPFVGIAMVGTGSFLFHMTLSYQMQLLDELPMLFAVTFTTNCVWNTQKPGQRQPVPYVGTFLFLLVSTVTVAYLYYPDPVLHQAAFAGILTSGVVRATYLIHTNLLSSQFELARNREFVRIQVKGIIFFASAFGIWLVDCFACDVLTDMKTILGKPFSFLLELHAWWHLGTGLGSYYLATSTQLLVLSLREDPHNIELNYAFYGILPYVKRVRSPPSPRTPTTLGGKAVPATSWRENTNGHAKHA
ncbi:alkaline phytoceramidase [Cystobasidium minutum MCA 4210]|uniref:alkaline phytoceramidase n=1 Tax=Cystobasidium minutum MCA 4210 TaxID=1397322 RepID=UPI0034CF584B|eukprot:jgi/Rhomi1/167091/fgenesh1_kg.2_\